MIVLKLVWNTSFLKKEIDHSGPTQYPGFLVSSWRGGTIFVEEKNGRRIYATEERQHEGGHLRTHIPLKFRGRFKAASRCLRSMGLVANWKRSGNKIGENTNGTQPRLESAPAILPCSRLPNLRSQPLEVKASKYVAFSLIVIKHMTCRRLIAMDHQNSTRCRKSVRKRFVGRVR